MRCFIQPSNDPFINSATEEYYLKSQNDDFFILYVNKNAVIAGKHQNIAAEINLPFCYKSQIQVARRLSGGGSVFHDEGNLNYCFILNSLPGKQINFMKYSVPIIEALKKYRLDVQFGKRHELIINNKKISGNAEHIYKNRVLHHGTLLFNTNLELLYQTECRHSYCYSDKAVRSVHANVANIQSFLKQDISFENFISDVFSFILNSDANNIVCHPSQIDNDNIRLLVENKYSTNQWIYGYSPEYVFEKEINKSFLNGIIKMKITEGIIREITITNLNPAHKHLAYILMQLVGYYHKPDIIAEKLSGQLESEINNQMIDELINELF